MRIVKPTAKYRVISVKQKHKIYQQQVLVDDLTAICENLRKPDSEEAQFKFVKLELEKRKLDRLK